MSRGTTYVRVHDDLADHPRWLEVSPAGIGLWVLSLGYCSRNLTDGYFPAILTRRWGGDDLQAPSELVSAGRWHGAGHGCPDCPPVDSEGQLYVHGYLDYQRSRAEVEELSKARSEAGKRGGQARAKQLAKQTPGKPKQEGSKSKPDTDTDTDTEEKPRARKRAAALPDDFRPSDRHMQLATELGVDLRAEWPQFVDHHRAKGSTMKDWGAALNTWIRNAHKFGRTSKPTTPPPSAPIQGGDLFGNFAAARAANGGGQ